MDAMETIGSPTIQYGFAGLSVILIGIIVWLIKQLLLVLKENNKIVAANTDAINRLINTSHEQVRQIEGVAAAVYSLKEKLLSRPCIASKENQ